jgi:DNA-binding transcriptional regulator YiaG
MPTCGLGSGFADTATEPKQLRCPPFAIRVRAIEREHELARHALLPIHCPHCGARIVPTPNELLEWRKANGFTRRQMGAYLDVSASYVTYLEQGKRSPSAGVIERYWKLIPR